MDTGWKERRLRNRRKYDKNQIGQGTTYDQENKLKDNVLKTDVNRAKKD